MMKQITSERGMTQPEKPFVLSPRNTLTTKGFIALLGILTEVMDVDSYK